MNITFQKNKMTLLNTLVKEGDCICFEATNLDFSKFEFKNLKGIKVISTIPSINTSVCDLQTREIAKIAKEFPTIPFLTISLDLPTALGNWCGVNKLDNLLVVSDYKEREFSTKYGLLIDELKLIHRTLIVVSADNKVLKIFTKEEITDNPDFDSLKKYLTTLV